MDMSEFIGGIDLGEEAPLHPYVQNAINAAYPPDELGAVALLRPEAPAPWSPRLTFDIALGEDPQILCDRYSITPEALQSLYFIAAFRREISTHQKQIREEGVTFRQKAKVQAEMYLEVLDDIVNDSDVSAATRLDAIKSVVKWGDLEPKDAKATGSGSGQPQFNIQINL